MKNSSMSLKAVVNNIAKKNKISAQAVLQTYMLERFLERISLSKYKDNFILKGGLLISAILGIENRNTMDMDCTLKNIILTEEYILKVIDEIIQVELDDNTSFLFKKIQKIREGDIYDGFRLTFEAIYDNMPVTFKIDVTTGDNITPRQIKYQFNLLFENRKINVWAYNIETILAEKYETVISRGVFNTRARDLYDIYMLITTNIHNIDKNILRKAIFNTSTHRKTDKIIKESEQIIESLMQDENFKKVWIKYKKENTYAENIEYEDVIDKVKYISEILNFKN